MNSITVNIITMYDLPFWMMIKVLFLMRMVRDTLITYKECRMEMPLQIHGQWKPIW